MRALLWCALQGSCPVLVSTQRIFAIKGVMALAFCVPLRYQIPMNDHRIENLASKLADSVPEGLRSMRDDLEENFRAVLQSGLGKLDLVTREEFAVQEAVLRRTREKLAALEARIAEFEKDSP